MKANALAIRDVFDHEHQLFAPLFQRPYVWEKDKQWVPLWNDIKKLAVLLLNCTSDKEAQNVKPHFFGAIVLDQYPVPIGKPDSRSIIDGQQRLATLQIFFKAFSDCIRDNNNLSLQAKKIKRLIFNEPVQDEADTYKVWPTNIDRDAYKAVLLAENPSHLSKVTQEMGIHMKSSIVQAYLYFYGVIEAWLDEATDDDGRYKRVDCLLNAVREKVHLVVIDMDDEDDAQSIFETLNARGTPLLPSDLIKNYLFHQAQSENALMDELHKKYWLEYDKNDGFWRSEYGIGHAKRPRIDLFLQHYLTLKTAGEVPAGGIFAAFKSFAEKVQKPVAWHLENLRDYGRHFKFFMEMETSPISAEGKFYQRLNIMQQTTVYPFLLELYQFTEGDEARTQERIKILGDVESFLVRRMVCRLSTRAYNTLFLDLLKFLLDKKDFSQQNVRQFLLKQDAESNRWPDDKEFMDSWQKVQIYHAITRPRLRMILLALDEAMFTPLTEKYTLQGNLTVEHIMPQGWEMHWLLTPRENETPESYLERKQRRNGLVHNIGNLTLLTKSLNPSVSNGPFDNWTDNGKDRKGKRDSILEHSAINLNRFLIDAKSWGEDEIIKRGEYLFCIVAGIWKHPTTIAKGYV